MSSGVISFDINSLTAPPQMDIAARYPLYGGDVELLYERVSHSYYVLINGDTKLVPGVTSITGTLDKPALLPWAVKLTSEFMIDKFLRASYLKDNDPLQRRFPDTDYDLLVKWATEAKFDYRNVSRTALDVGHEAHDWLERVQKAAIEHQTTVQVVVMSGAFPLPTFTAEVTGLDEQLAKEKISEAARDTEHVHNCCNAAVEWMVKHNFRPLRVENKIYSRMYNFAGTFDDIAVVDSCGDPEAECCSIVKPGGMREPLHFKNLKVLSDWKSSKGMYDEYRFQTAAYKEAWEEENGEELGGRIVVKLGKDDGKFAAYFLPNEDHHKDFGAFIGLMTAYERVNEVKELEREGKGIAKALKNAEKAQKKADDKTAKESAKALKAAERAAAKEAKKKHGHIEAVVAEAVVSQTIQ